MINYFHFKRSLFSISLFFVIFCGFASPFQAPKPNIEVSGNGILITDGDITPSIADNTDFGQVSVPSGSVIHTFTISNTGNGDLTFDNPSPYILLSGDVTDFTITAIPSSPIAGSSSTTFQITFDPTSVGTKTVEISIVTNVTGQASNYTFTLQGTGTIPEINITGNSNTINNGDTTPSITDDTYFGSTDITVGTISKIYTIENTGIANLTIGAITFSGPHASDFSVTSSPTASVSASGSTTFTVTFNPSATGIRTATISIVNDDSDENPYTFSIQGMGTSAIQEIEISGNGNTILNGDTSPSIIDDTDFGDVLITGSTNVNIFTIYNYGTSNNLNLTGASPYVLISGTNAADFSVTTIPGSPILANSNTTFAITFSPTSIGPKSATISISNDDSEENPYTFDISGNGTLITGPGGIDTDLQLWLKSTDGLSYTNGQAVSLWEDQGNASNATVPAAGLEPTYRDDPAYNINFNPVIDFDNDYDTAIEDYTFSDTNRNTLVGTSGFYTQDIFLVTIPDINASSSTASMDVFCGDRDPLTDERDGTGIGFGAYSVRFENEILSYAVGTSPTGSSTPIADRGYGIAHTGTTDSYSNAGIINSKNDNVTTPTANILFFNGNGVGNTEVGLPQFSNVNDSRFFLGRSEAYKGSFDGRICEVITYSSKKSDADLTQERNRIQSYLAIKYGITLGINGISQDYVDSSGNLIWDQSANATFNYDIAGIGRDDLSELNQKQSSSINNATDIDGPIEGILTIGLSDIYDTNNLNKASNPTSLNDKEYLVWGNNGADLNLAATTVTINMSAGISPALTTNVTFTSMQRTWKVVETGGDIPACKVKIPQNTIRNITPPGSYLMFISDTGVFDPTADYRVMTSDGNGNLETTYDFDNTKYITFGYAPQVIVERSIYFDGVVDYVDMEDALDLNTTAYTISAWIKRDAGCVNASILSKRDAIYSEGYDFKINGSGHFEFDINGGAETITSSVAIPENEWHHVAVIYNGSNATLYIDGVADASALLSAPTSTSQSFYIAAAGKSTPTAHFSGNIDEVRVWNTALSEAQLHYIMNQEIENLSSNVDGKIIPASITKNEVNSIPWANLAGYYPMSVYTYTNTNDESGNNNQGALRNLDTVDRQTAPLPYQSQADGDWSTDATWLNNAVQTLPNDVSIIDGTTPISWNIVQTNHNINIDTYTNLGRQVELQSLEVKNGVLQVNGSTDAGTGNGLVVTHYLKLDGSLDLEGESQLIQSTGSDFDLSSSGFLERDQQGNSNTYIYNYWSSPIAPASNSSYDLLDIITNVGFLTSGYDGTALPTRNADYWIWKYANRLGDTYSEWQHVRSTGSILAGEGFTMKGPGTATPSQNYILRGKPNNGDISLEINIGNDYLVGNPYASAIDANEFILDNISTADGGRNTNGNVINGALYFWDHFAINSHVLAEYQGGYATYTLIGGTAAISNDTRINATGISGTKEPERYIPIAQGFFVSATLDASLAGLTEPVVGGDILFKNSQRIFKKEEITGSNSGSIFMKNNSGKSTEISNSDIDTRQKIRLLFDSPDGYHRQLLVGVDDKASNDFDLGYDALLIETNQEDMFWQIENANLTIQAINNFDQNQVLSLGLKTSKDGMASIKIDTLENIDSQLNIYVHDLELNIYHNLKESNYEVYLTSGEYLDRFEITFSDLSEALNTEDFDENLLNIYYSNEKTSIILMNSKLIDLNSAELFNILGQSVIRFDNIKNENYQELKTEKLTSGSYILKLTSNEGTISKKVLIK